MQADLVVLVPDRNTEASMEGILARHESLRIRQITTRILVHPEKDPGCRLHGHELLRTQQRFYSHALLIFDREGSGGETQTSRELESRAEDALASAGWGQRAAAIVIDPELDIWVWSDSPVVEQCIGWGTREPRLREWLRQKGFTLREGVKPTDPKEALQAARDLLRKPRSSSLYKDLALRVSLERCQDQAFVKLRTRLRDWFGAVSG